MARSDLVKLTHPRASSNIYACVFLLDFSFHFMCWDYCVFFSFVSLCQGYPPFLFFTPFTFYLQCLLLLLLLLPFFFFQLQINCLLVSSTSTSPPFLLLLHTSTITIPCALFLTSNIHLNPYITSSLIALTCPAVPSFRPPPPFLGQTWLVGSFGEQECVCGV